MKRLAFVFCLFAAVAHAHTRGTDFSGDLSDAGGIGGLLARSDASGSVFYHADGSGNVTALIDGSENIIGRYLYNPFGKIIGQWGGKASANEMKFSSMPAYWFGGSGYSERVWLQDQQRWANNDPTQEAGGNNMAAGMDNDPLNEIDPWGLWVIEYTNPDGTRKVYSPKFPNGITVPPDANVYPDGSVDVNPNVDKGRINTDDDPWEMIGPGVFLKPKPKLTSCPILPKNPDDLLKMGYKETSHPKALKAGHRTFENPQTGDKLRFDKGKPGETGHEANDHYHQSNPN